MEILGTDKVIPTGMCETEFLKPLRF